MSGKVARYSVKSHTSVHFDKPYLIDVVDGCFAEDIVKIYYFTSKKKAIDYAKLLFKNSIVVEHVEVRDLINGYFVYNSEWRCPFDRR